MTTTERLFYQEYMFEEGSFRRRPRGFRRKALKPYPGPAGLYQVMIMIMIVMMIMMMIMIPVSGPRSRD